MAIIAPRTWWDLQIEKGRDLGANLDVKVSSRTGTGEAPP